MMMDNVKSRSAVVQITLTAIAANRYPIVIILTEPVNIS